MTFKATIDIAVNISFVKIRMLNKQGYIRYRMKIYYVKDQVSEDCHPYNIVRGQAKNKRHNIDEDNVTQSQLDSDQQYYYSKLIFVRYKSDDWLQNQSVFFKVYVPAEQIDSIQFFCEVDCMFSEQPKENFQIIGRFKAKIHKMYNISTYLPISFDQFQGFTICSTFHSTIMEFKYECTGNLEEKSKIFSDKSSYDFWSYVDSITSGFSKEETKHFYEYYRGFLEHQLYKLQDRHQDLMKENEKKQEGYKFIKITKNREVMKSIESMKSRKLITISTSEQERLVELILQDFTNLKAHIYKKWNQFINFIIENSITVTNKYQKIYKEMCNERFKNNVFSHRVKNHDWKVSKYEDSGKHHIEQAYKEKKKIMAEKELWTEHFPIENCRFFGKSETHIKMFEEIYETNIKEQSNLSGVKHIIVMVHGFQASRQDFLLLKGCLQINYNAQVYVSTCNEGLTEQSIVNLGKRLAIQLSKILVGNKKDYRLSFIGHSLGGLIIRAAIPFIKQFSQKFYLYMSLSTPHLGYLYQPPTLIQAGLWIMNTWQKCDSIQEMSMRDHSDLRNTTLYKISKNESLKNFKKICFLSSSQDQYVPYESARVEENRKIINEKIGKPDNQIIGQMVQNMIGQVSCAQISRINVVFNIANKNIDSFIGRTGHVKFLSDTQFIKEFCCCFDKFFQ